MSDPKFAGIEVHGTQQLLRRESADVGGSTFDGADADVAILKKVEFNHIVDGAAMKVRLEAEEAVASVRDRLASGGYDDGGFSIRRGVGRPIFPNHLRTRTGGMLQQEAVEFVAAEPVGGLR